ncbi:ABC transporter permease [Arthrobacter sp. NPDC080073]|uniref:ABC transporter permease n=1 Tax=Arthrobacter sp. NPDC080073 TaxID=3155919 RepID=UPI00342784D8
MNEKAALVSTDPAKEASVARSRGFREWIPIDGYAAVLFFVAFFIVVAVLEGQSFASWTNISLVLGQNAYIVFAALGVTITLIAGQFDLSIGPVLGFSALLVADLTANRGVSTPIAILVVIVVAAVIGLVNGVLVVGAQVSAFITTLATGGAVSGVALILSNSAVVYSGVSPELIQLGAGRVLGISVLFWIALVMVGTAWLLTRQTVQGREWFAMGANAEGARLAGVRVGRGTVLAFVVGAVIAGFGGVLLTGLLGSASPSTGPGLLLPAFAAAFLGSSILSDGRFTVVGTFVATFLVAIAGSGLDSLGIPAGAKPVFTAVVLIGAVWLTTAIRRRGGSRRRPART